MRLSISKIKMFKGCRRQYQLHYIEGLTPIETPQALVIGKNYHAKLESLYNGEELEKDFSKESAMVEAYKKYIFPKFKVNATEKDFTYDLGGEDFLYGIVDGVAQDGCIVEHKTTSMEITPQYEYLLMWDEQILAYMLMTGANTVYYTVCRKPTIRQKKGETEEKFYKRMIEWYDTDTDTKIQLLKIQRTSEEVEEFKNSLFLMLAEMKECNNFYRNQGWCNKWGRLCEYASVCLHYDPNQEYVEFVKGDNENG